MPLSMIIIIDERGDETKKIMLIVYLPLMTTVKNTGNVSEAEPSDPSSRRPHPCDCPRPAMTTLHIYMVYQGRRCKLDEGPLFRGERTAAIRVRRGPSI